MPWIIFVIWFIFKTTLEINKLIIQAARLAAFQRRVDALAVSVVFSAGLEQVIAVDPCSLLLHIFPDKDKNRKTITHNMKINFSLFLSQGDSGRPGYRSTSGESSHPTGLDCFPTVFSCPQNIPDHLFPGLVSHDVHLRDHHRQTAVWTRGFHFHYTSTTLKGI